MGDVLYMLYSCLATVYNDVIVSAASQWLAGNIRPSSKAYPFKDRNIAAKFR